MRATKNTTKSPRFLDSRDRLVKACMEVLDEGNLHSTLSPAEAIRGAPRYPIQCEATEDGLPVIIFLQCPMCRRPHSIQREFGLRFGSHVRLSPDISIAAVTHFRCVAQTYEDDAAYGCIRRAVAGSLLHAICGLGDLGKALRRIDRKGASACSR